ncbi:MAG: hypothetical protein ACMUIE_02700 [Thermoplasmatota archaeon]
MEYADCKMCGCGQLLPFTSPDGFLVYFCTYCRAKFSGYVDDPMFEGSPIFAEMAYYSMRDTSDHGESFTRGELMDAYKSILDEFPPQPSEENVPECPKCSKELLIQYDLIDLAWLPEV